MAFNRSLKIANPSMVGRERTYLTSRYAVGAVALEVANTNNFSVNRTAVIGVPGEEKTEAKRISAITDIDTLAIPSTLSFSHPANTPIYESKWDQIQVQRKASGGAFANITGSPFEIDWDNEDGFTYIDISTNFALSDTYRWQFISSGSSDESGYADTLGGTGLSRDSVGYAIKMIKQNPVAKNIPSATIVEYFNDLHDEEYENNPEAWYLQKQGTEVSTVADTATYNISDNISDFGRMKYLMFHYTSGDIDDIYPLTFISELEMRNRKINQNEVSDDKATNWSFYPPDSNSRKGYIVIDPTPDTADQGIIPVYYQELDAVDSFGDTLVIPKIKIYVDYALYRIYEDIEEDISANKFEARVKRDLTGLKARQHRQLGQKEFLKWRGQKGSKQMFNSQSSTGQTEKELYW